MVFGLHVLYYNVMMITKMPNYPSLLSPRVTGVLSLKAMYRPA